MKATATLRKVTPKKVPTTDAPAPAPNDTPVIDAVVEVVEGEFPPSKKTLRRINKELKEEKKTQSADPTNDGFADALLSDLPASAYIAASNAPEKALATTEHRPSNRVDYNEASNGGFEGDFDSSDLRFPRLQVVNGSGKMSELFTQGDVVLAGELLFSVGEGSPDRKNVMARYGTLKVIPVHLKKQWRQNLTQEESGAGMMPIVVDTKAEAEELGGPMVWVGNERPRWTPSGRILFLIEQPEGKEDHPAFSISCGGKNYAAAVFYASGGSYSGTANQIFNTAQWGLRDPKDKSKIRLALKEWHLDFGKTKAGDYYVYRPAMKVTAVRTDEAVWDLAETLAGTKSENIDGDDS